MKLLILDRDGTINADRDDYVKSVDEWEPLPGALEALARLHQAGWHLVVATNQAGIGRGLFSTQALGAMHTKMHKLLAAHGARIDAVFYCPHTPEDGCNCRKPLPGLFEQIIARYGVDPSAGTVHVAGDTLRDMQAGAAVGCVPHLVLTGKSESLKNRLSTDPSAGRPVDPPADFPPHTHVHADLAALAHHLLSAS